VFTGFGGGMTFAEIWKGVGTGAAIYGEGEDATGACAVRSWWLYYAVLFNVGLRSGVTMRAAAAIFMLTIVAWIVVTTP
jgi:hypothetical protein